jgi:hypothetical protein
MFFPEFPPGRDLANPYVINPRFFENTTGNYVYEGSWLDIGHRVSNAIALSLGGSLTLLVFYLIAYKTPKHFQPYSKMLMLCATLVLKEGVVE